MGIHEVIRRGEDRPQGLRKEKLKPQKKLFGAFLHTYQPPRDILLLDGRLDVLRDVNGRIMERCYRSMLVEGELPEAMNFSFYGSTRDWMKKDHKEEFKKIKEKIARSKDREHRVFGDPYLHIILPLLESNDQDMLIKIGKKAFEEDFGFSPEIFWLPETAVSMEVLRNLHKNGYSAVILRGDQLLHSGANPVFVEVGENQRIAVVHFNKMWSEKISRDGEYTRYEESGDNFLQDIRDFWDSNFFIGMDTETFGEHWEYRDMFFRYVASLNNLERYGISSLDLKAKINGGRTRGTVIENSSWSCEHGLGRWTGECGCGCKDEGDRLEKKYLFGRLKNFQEEINLRLDSINPRWRDDFIEIFLRIREDFFTGENVYSKLEERFPDQKYRNLLIAKLYALSGMTSCGWFEQGQDRPERQIPRKMIEQILLVFEFFA